MSPPQCPRCSQWMKQLIMEKQMRVRTYGCAPCNLLVVEDA